MRFFFIFLSVIFLFSTCHKKDPDAKWLVGKWRLAYINSKIISAQYNGSNYILGGDTSLVTLGNSHGHLFEIYQKKNGNFFSVENASVYEGDTSSNYFKVMFEKDSFLLAKDLFIKRKGLFIYNNEFAYPLLKVKRISKNKLHGRIIELGFSQRPLGLVNYNIAFVGDVEFSKEE